MFKEPTQTVMTAKIAINRRVTFSRFTIMSSKCDSNGFHGRLEDSCGFGHHSLSNMPHIHKKSVTSPHKPSKRVYLLEFFNKDEN